MMLHQVFTRCHYSTLINLPYRHHLTMEMEAVNMLIMEQQQNMTSITTHMILRLRNNYWRVWLNRSMKFITQGKLALMDEKDLEFKVEEYSRDPNSLITGNRILHTFTSQKNSSPKAIFTCSQQHPWKFRAANDLACLIFGISMNAMRALTLLDLIHSDSRNFVLNKIMTTEGQEQVFTGEIVGIKQPGHASSGLIWSSIWAKRKNGLIVCVFEKVPCDYMDVLLNLEDYSIENVVGGEGLQYDTKNFSMKEPQEVDGTGKKSVKFEHQLPDVESISKSLWQVVKDVTSGKLMGPDDDLLPMPLRVANTINDIRYYTLNYLEYNIPCAVSCSILDTELKLA